MKEEKTKTEDIEKSLTSLYQIGDPGQQQLFEAEGDLYERAKKFYKLVNVEACKRRTNPPALIKYFTEHEKELIRLWKKKGIKYPAFPKIYTHSQMENIMHKVLKTQKLKDKGISNIDEDSITGKVQIWESKGVEYIVKAEDLLKLDGKNPKVYVTQIKSLLLLMGLIQEQQFNNHIKEAKCEFTLSHYAARRGYTKEDIQKSGKFWEELKRDLFSGAYTTYRIKEALIDGKRYNIHNTFYGLYEPKNPEDNWKIYFNNPYNEWILEILNKKARRYFTEDHRAIEDRATTNKPYLFLFYMQLAKRKRANLLTAPLKIGSLLNDMKLEEQILARPKECFKVLWECLIYFSEHYQPVPEIESFNLYNDFHKTKTIKTPLRMIGYLRLCAYEEFKAVLGEIGIKDIRKAYISFKRPKETPGRGYGLTDEEHYILEKTLNWFKDKVTEIPFEDQETLVTRYIKKIGYERYRILFEREANKINANAVEFLTRVLPDISTNINKFNEARRLAGD